MNLKKIIKEEMDDLQWIKDINPEIERFNTGEIITVHNVGGEEAFLDFLGMWKSEYLRGDFGPNITGRVSLENHLGTFGLMVKGRDGDMAEIYFPYPRLIKRYQDNGDYPGLGIEYELLPKESITESEDDLKWMKDVQEVLPKNEDWILVNDVDIYDIEEGKKIQKYVFNHDIPWATGDKRVMSLPIHTIHHKNQQKAIRKGFTYRSTDSIERTKYIIEQWEKAGLLVLYWSQIKPKEITESDDPLQWIKDVKVNPWDGIEFKLSTNKYLTTTYKILDWGDPKGVRVVWRDNDHYRNEWKHTHYTREEVENYFNKGRWVIVNENITESEDDLQWITDIKSYPTLQQLFDKGEIKEGDVLVLRGEVKAGNEGGEITWVNDFTVTINSEGERLSTTGFNLDPNEIDAKKAMALCGINNITFLESDGNLEVIRKNNQSTQLTESDDLQWIRDINTQLTKNDNWWLINDVDPNSLEISEEIQDFLFNQGFSWISGRREFLPERFYAVSHLIGDDNSTYNGFGFYSHWLSQVPNIEKEIEREKNMKGGEIYYWSQLKPDFLNESQEDDLQWIRDVEPEDPYNPYIGMKWVVKDEKTLSLYPIVYEIIDMTQEGMTLKWVGNMGEVKSAPFSLENYVKLVRDGRVKIVNNIVKESDDLDWIRNIKPDRTTPQKGFIYRYYGYTDGFLGLYDDIGTDDIIITAVVGDRVYFDTINRYWANHPHDPGSDSLHIDTFNNSVGRGDIQYLGISGINESEEDNELQWIMDIKTNNDIAQEIYDGLEWYKEPNVSTDFVKNQWSDINFSVRPGFTEKPIISPSSFYRGFTKWVEEKWGIEKERTLDVYWKLIELIHNKIKKPITEADDPLQWIKDVNPIPELKVGSCFIDSMTQREWTIVALPKVGESRTEMVRVLSNTIRKDDGAIIPSKYVNIRREYFEWDLVNGRYKPCQR